jgi:hypothetical protein
MSFASTSRSRSRRPPWAVSLSASRAISASAADGAFCFVFLEPRYHQTDVGDDLDAASFGIGHAMNTPARDGSPRITWTAKSAFRRLAELHRSATSADTAARP